MSRKERKPMKFTLRSAGGAIALTAILGLAAPLRAAGIAEGSEAPNIAGTWLNSEATSLKDLRGQAVLLEFWGIT